MNYYITYMVDARYVVEVNADNVQEALQKADNAFSEANFGEAQDIDGTVAFVEDENDMIESWW